MSRAAQAVQQFVDEQRRQRKTGRKAAMAMDEPTERPDEEPGQQAADPAAEPVETTTTGNEENDVAKKQSEKKKRNTAKGTRRIEPSTGTAPRKAKAKPPGPLSGLKAAPKGRSLFVNTAGALSVMLKALQALLRQGKLSDQEKSDATRLVARLESRGVA